MDTGKKPDDLEEGLDEFLEQVGSELDPLQALSNALTRCGKTEFKIEGQTLFIPRDSAVCEGLSVQETSRSCELFCTDCGISCEIRLVTERSVQPDSSETDDMDEFLDLVHDRSDSWRSDDPDDDEDDFG